MSGLTACDLPLVYGVGVVTCTRIAPKRAIQHQYLHAAAAGWWTERNLIPPAIEAAGMQRKRCKRVAESIQDYNAKSVLFHPHLPKTVLHGSAMHQHTATETLPALSCTGLPCHIERKDCLPLLS
jgi:hypothetical protein